MCSTNVVLEIFSVFLYSLSWSVADVTVITFILQKIAIYLPEWAEWIKHNTRNDISEQNSKENTVYHVVHESHNLKGFHCLADRTWYKQLQNAV
jgi:hypothetical protein